MIEKAFSTHALKLIWDKHLNSGSQTDMLHDQDVNKGKSIKSKPENNCLSDKNYI